jgi:response regulator RpfG family c-di-GMP phosphodiesterase
LVTSEILFRDDPDGLDLLQHVRTQFTDTIRIPVTCHREITAARAVNEGVVHRYFFKPWSDELRAACRATLRGYLHMTPSGASP